MAETVLSMARSPLESAVSKAASAAADEMSMLIGVRTEMWYIKDELKTMQAFLRAAERMKDKDELVKVWAEQVRDLSYDIEDCLDEFKVHVGHQSCLQQLMKLRDRHQIAVQIRNLKSRVEEVSMRNQRYGLIKPIPSSSTDERDSCMEDIRNQSASNVDEAELVGFAEPKKKLLDLIDVHADDGPRKVIFVVGMGGLGKTTIARKIYESKEDIPKNFSCCAWITVSSFVRTELLKDMIMQLFGGDELKNLLKKLEGKVVQVEDLAKHLREKLEEKRYFIVLDDLWTIDAWNWIKGIAFPSDNSKGSRIIVTTRDIGLAKECTSESLIYHLKPLQIDDAIKLLLRKMNKTHEEMENDENLKDRVIQLVKKCGRLPLAILTIGAVFAAKHVSEWESLYKQLPSELENNPSLEATRRMVTLSYNHLPSHLKPCFLYLSIFPEDFEIQRRRLVDRWIAEGFVRARVGINIEDVGKRYFNELINRSMIQPSRVDIQGAVKSCRVHDIIRDITVSISREEHFVYSTGDDVTSLEEHFRHLAYHGSKSPNVGIDWSHVRSLTVFGERPTKPTPSLCSPQLRMLRALDLQDAKFKITQKDMNNIGLLCHLKYVNIRYAQGYSNIYALPRSIGKLQDLQILDIRDTHITTLPNEINKLRSLRSLRCRNISGYYYFDPDDPKEFFKHTLCLPMVFTPLFDHDERTEVIAELHMAYSSCWSNTRGVRVPRGIGNLKELQILDVVDIKRTSSKAIKELENLSQLRKLGIRIKGATEKKCQILCEVIQKLSSLQSLIVDAVGYKHSSVDEFSDSGTLEWMNSISPPPPLLRTLKLGGYLGEMPSWFGNLAQLVKLILWSSELKEGKSMEILGALPNRMLLRLHRKAYAGEKLVFGAGAFPNLRKLDIWGQEQLREVRFEEGTSPQMEEIEINDCRLESGIIGIEHLPRLRKISLDYGGKVARLGKLQEEVDAHHNHPVLRMRRDRSYHDLGDVDGSAVQVEATETGESSQAVTLTNDRKLDLASTRDKLQHDTITSCDTT